MTDNNNNNHECWRTDGNNADADDWLGTRNNQPLRIRTNNTQRMVITPAGNVGIGTDTPETATGGLALHIHNPNGASALRLGDGAVNGQQWEWQSTVINNVGALNLSKLTPPLANPLTVLANGNVGIGTTTPSQRLTLGSGNVLLTNANVGDDGNLYFGGITNAGQTGLRLFGGLVNGTEPAGFIDVRSTDPNDGLRIRVDTANGGIERMRVTAGGRVGIGLTNPAFPLDVAGQAHATNFVATSDVRFKTNVKELTNVLDKLEKIRAVSFQWNELYESLGRSTGRAEIGVIAQEVEAIFPELVTAWGDESYKGVDYGRLSGVLIEAVKELKAQDEVLRARIEALEGA